MTKHGPTFSDSDAALIEPHRAFPPRSRVELVDEFGHPGSVDNADEKWIRTNVVPFEHKILPRKLWIHRRIREPLLQACARAYLTSPYAHTMARVGCLSHRHTRHDPDMPLSLHSWGIALDIDPKQNRAQTFDRSQAPEPWSLEWQEIWPHGVDRELVEAFESAGFRWGGLWGRACGNYNERIKRVRYVDPMHFEFYAP